MTTTTAVRTLSGPATLRPKQVLALLRAPDGRRRLGKRDAALLAVLACGGLRLGECVRLTLDCVELGTRVRITTRCAKSRNQRSRTVTLPGPAAKLLRDWLAYSEPRWWVFPGRRNEPLTTRQAGRIVRQYLEKIGRPDLHPHSLRHTVGALVTKATGGTRTAQKILGHQNQTTTDKYYSCWDLSDADAAADALESML